MNFINTELSLWVLLIYVSLAPTNYLLKIELNHNTIIMKYHHILYHILLQQLYKVVSRLVPTKAKFKLLCYPSNQN